jgi:hypothetical protein
MRRARHRDHVLGEGGRSLLRRAIVIATIAPLVLAACLVAIVPAQAAKQKRPKPCVSRNALHQNDHVVLQERYRAGDDEYDVIACHRKTRRRKDIATFVDQVSSADPPPPVFWLAGRFVAAHAFNCPPGGFPCRGYIIVTDLRTGRFRRTPDTGGPVRDLVLTDRGRLAYIRSTSGSPGDPNVQVVEFTATDTINMLDAGQNIDPDSLASDDRHIYWLRDGQPRFAPFG